MNISIVGSGVYAKSIAKLILANGTKVTMWTECNDFNSILVPEGTIITNSYEVVSKNDIIFILTSSNYVEDVLTGLKEFIRPSTMLVLGSKGILKDGTLISELIEKMLPKTRFAILSGPTFAIDIAALEPVGFTLATDSLEDYDTLKNVLDMAYTEYSSDTLAVELAGSLKNAYAIGAGILSSFDYGVSTSCLYMTRVLFEMSNIFDFYGSNESTVTTLAGVGDLVLTCSSPNSRNYTFGSLIALGTDEQKREFLKSHTVEGYENLITFVKLFKKKGIQAPILECVHDIVESNSNAENLIEILLKK